LVAVPSIGRASEVTPRRAAPEADATRDLYERYARQIYTYCLHQLGNREEAEDAVQSTFLNAFRGYQRGVDPEFESAWLYKIAQNVCLTRQRSSSRRRRVETASDLDAMQDYVPAHEFDADELINLPEALDAMPHQQRKALLLREWQGLSYKEIADELDLSQAAVETLLFRARRTLAAGLSDEPAKKSTLRSLRTGGDAGSALAILKSLLFTGGAKVATAVATVAATSVVAATPTARHAVEDVVTPGHDPAPAAAHQIARTPASGGAPASSRIVVPSRLVTSVVAANSRVTRPRPAHGHQAPAAFVLRAPITRAHVPAPAPAPAASVQQPADTAPAAPAEPAPVTPAPADEPTPSAPAPSDPAPAATQPAPAPEKAKGDDKKNDVQQPSSTPAAAKKDDGASNGNNGNNGKGARTTSSTTTTPTEPAAGPAADPAPQNGNGNGKNGDKGKGNKHADVAPTPVPAPPVAVTTTTAATPVPAATTTTTVTTVVTTTSAAPTPAPSAASQPAVTAPQPTSPDTNGNGRSIGKGQGHRK
jgi:RNA polymerase sigma factor (sigma-70 family)